MKKNLLTLIITATTLMAFAQQTNTKWTWQAPRNFQHFVSDGAVFSADAFYLAGDNGDFWKTTDGGITFTQSNIPQRADSYSLYFLNALQGWSATSDGKVYYTADGGKTWTLQLIDPASPSFRYIHFSDANTGYVVGDAGFVDNAMYKTNNGGRNWIKVENLQSRPADFAGMFYVKAFSKDTVYAASWNNLLYRSFNAGTSWDTVYTDVENTASYFEGGHFTNAKNGWLVGPNQTIVHTNDYGSTWKKQLGSVDSTAEYRTYFSEVFFLNDSLGWASAFGCLYKTTNGGKNWIPRCDVYGGGRKGMIYFTDAQRGITITGSEIFLTTDGGNTFTNINKNYAGTFTEATFLNNQTGFTLSTSGDIFKTINGGTSWVKKNTDTHPALRAVEFANTSVGFIVGDMATVLKSVDGGETWSNITVPTGLDLNALDVLDENTLVAVGDSNVIVKSTDGGATWTLKTVKTATNLLDVYMLSATRGIAVGTRGYIALTENGGDSWKTVTSGVLTNLQDAHFVNATTGYIAGNNGRILQTNDGGQTWLPQVSGVAATLNSIHFADEKNGWAVGSLGTVIRTTDGGVTWARDTTFPSVNFFSRVYFTDVNTGWVFGTNGNILKYQNTTTATARIQVNADLQVFPNPTQDRFQIKNLNESARLVLYTASGKQVQTMRSDNGEFDLMGLSAGLYIGRLVLAKGQYVVKIVKTN